MIITPLFFLAIFPAVILIAGVLVMLIARTNEGRENLHLIISSTNLIIILVVIIISAILPRQEIFFNILLSPSQYILIGIIFLFQFIFSIFIKFTSKDYPHSYIFDILSFLIFLSLIGIVITMDFLSLTTFFISAILLLGMAFYFGEFKKEFDLLKNYFIAGGLSLISLILSILIIYFDTGTLQIIKLESIGLSTIASNSISILIILGLGLPCGLFPFYIIHLKKFFQECDYFHFVILMVFSFISMMTIIRLLKTIIMLNSFIILILLIISGLGVAIAIYSILLELFTVQDGFTYSVKKLIGYSIIGDSNLILFFYANFNLLSESFRNNLLNLLIFFYISTIIIKLLLLISFLKTANKSNEDNFRLLGNFWKNSKIYGVILFLSGIVLIFPLVFIFIYFLFENYEIVFVSLNSVISLISYIAISLLIISIVINLLFTSRFFIQIYVSTNVSYIEKESFSHINKTLIYLISIVLIVAIILNVIVYFSIPYWYLGLISIS